MVPLCGLLHTVSSIDHLIGSHSWFYFWSNFSGGASHSSYDFSVLTTCGDCEFYVLKYSSLTNSHKVTFGDQFMVNVLWSNTYIQFSNKTTWHLVITNNAVIIYLVTQWWQFKGGLICLEPNGGIMESSICDMHKEIY